MAVLVSTFVLAFVALQTAPSATPPLAQAAAQSQPIDGAREITLTPPHPLRKGETAWLLVEVGAIGRDQIKLTTDDGTPLGTISPLGEGSGKAGGTYTVPIPAEALRDGKLALRLSVMQSGHAPRPATAKEVKSLRLVLRQFKESR